MWCGCLTEGLINDTGPNDRELIARSDFEDAVECGGGEHDRAVACHRSAGEPGSRPAGHNGDAVRGRQTHDLLHLTDAVGVLTGIIAHGAWGHTFNVCAAQHPRRRDFYPAAAEFLALESPTFQDENGASGKTIDSSLVRNVLPYEFQHDDVLAALAHC